MGSKSRSPTQSRPRLAARNLRRGVSVTNFSKNQLEKIRARLGILGVKAECLLANTVCSCSTVDSSVSMRWGNCARALPKSAPSAPFSGNVPPEQEVARSSRAGPTPDRPAPLVGGISSSAALPALTDGRSLDRLSRHVGSSPSTARRQFAGRSAFRPQFASVPWAALRALC
jgi:hypothetical protein